MPCTKIALPGGGVAIVCSRVNERPPPPCEFCRARPAKRRCDWKVLKLRGPRGGVLKKPTPGTCDAWLCEVCTHEPAPDKDLCPHHAAKWAARQAKETTCSETN